jgi:hypothetical protein
VPSDYLNQYRDRVNKTAADRLIDHSKQMFTQKFIGNPNYKVLTINGVQFETLYSQGKTSDEKSLLFTPNTKIDIGTVVDLNSNHYLIMDFLGEGINEIYPSATLMKCNSTYPIKGNKTKVLKLDTQGKPILDKFGDPVYTYTEGAITNLPCIVESSIIGTDENKQLPLPQGQLRVTMQYRNDVKVNDTFTMYNNTYKIRSINFTKVINEKGIIMLSVEQVQSEVK